MGYNKQDPPTKKMLPVKVDVPELLVEMGYGKSGSPHAQAIGDLLLIVFYYLLRIGKYTVKGKRNYTKQTVEFKLEDVTFFKKNKVGTLVCLPRTALASVVMSANSATLKLDNPKKWVDGVVAEHSLILGTWLESQYKFLIFFFEINEFIYQ